MMLRIPALFFSLLILAYIKEAETHPDLLPIGIAHSASIRLDSQVTQSIPIIVTW
jgi:hypothetical protein